MIKFHLNKFEKMLRFQIIDQTREWKSGLLYEYKNDYKKIEIRKVDSPEIQMNSNKISIYLRGRERSINDFKIQSIDFRSNEERDLAYNTILEAFSEMKLNKPELFNN